jgi:hypothetical protein
LMVTFGPLIKLHTKTQAMMNLHQTVNKKL